MIIYNKIRDVLIVLMMIFVLLIAGCNQSQADTSESTPVPPSPKPGEGVAEDLPATPNDPAEAISITDTGAESNGETAPASAQTGLKYIYQDDLSAGWGEWSWDIIADYHNPDPVYKGQQSLSVTPDRAWAGWAVWHDDGIDTTPYAYLNIAIQATKKDEWYIVYLLDRNGETLSADDYLINPSVNSWDEVQIPLSELGAAYTQIHGIRIMNTESTLGTYYLDEVGFGGTAPRPTATPIPLPQDIQLSVDARQLIHPFSNEMLGVALVNWEHSWDKYFPADVPHLADVFESANVGVIRYAGGLWANWVGWERLPQRTPYTEWQPDSANYSSQFSDSVNENLAYAFHYGINEIDNLALFSQQTGAEIMIQVNVSMNDPYMWADMLHYTNVENDYQFKYWELGNEIDLETGQGNETGMDADTYQRRAQQYADVLRSVDPNIVIVGGVPGAGHDIGNNNWAEGNGNMSRYLKAAVAAGSDSLSYHWYQNCDAYEDLDAVTIWEWELGPGTDGIADSYQNWRHMYSRIWSRIGPERVQNEVIPAGSPMTQGITELNFDACDFGVAPQNSNHINAVWMADILGRLAYNGVDYVTWYAGYGTQEQGYPMVFSQEDYYPETVYLRPPYYTLFLYANYFGDQLVASASSKEEDISIWASMDSDDPNTLKLIITNISNSVVHSNIDIAGFSAVSGMKFELSNPNPLDMTSRSNSQEHGTTINGITLDAASITSAVDQITGVPVSIQGGDLKETFAPYTVTAVILKAE